MVLHSGNRNPTSAKLKNSHVIEPHRCSNPAFSKIHVAGGSRTTFSITLPWQDKIWRKELVPYLSFFVLRPCSIFLLTFLREMKRTPMKMKIWMIIPEKGQLDPTNGPRDQVVKAEGPTWRGRKTSCERKEINDQVCIVSRRQ